MFDLSLRASQRTVPASTARSDKMTEETDILCGRCRWQRDRLGWLAAASEGCKCDREDGCCAPPFPRRARADPTVLVFC